jgi:MFS family permease
MVSYSAPLRDFRAEFAQGLDTTVAADVQAQVYEDLGHIQNLQWVGLGFPMASASVILIYTRGYGLFNVKVLIISSFLMFEIGSAVCGAAPTSNALIVGRVIAGMGGAGMYLGLVNDPETKFGQNTYNL